MKLTLQLVVFVLNVQTNFRDSLLKFTLHTMTQGKRHGISVAMLTFQHNFFTKFELQR